MLISCSGHDPSLGSRRFSGRLSLSSQVYTSLGNSQALMKAMTDYDHVEHEERHREQRFLIPVRPGNNGIAQWTTIFIWGSLHSTMLSQQLSKPPNLWKDANYH